MRSRPDSGPSVLGIYKQQASAPTTGTPKQYLDFAVCSLNKIQTPSYCCLSQSQRSSKNVMLKFMSSLTHLWDQDGLFCMQKIAAWCQMQSRDSSPIVKSRYHQVGCLSIWREKRDCCHTTADGFASGVNAFDRWVGKPAMHGQNMVG